MLVSSFKCLFLELYCCGLLCNHRFLILHTYKIAVVVAAAVVKRAVAATTKTISYVLCSVLRIYHLNHNYLNECGHVLYYFLSNVGR